MSDQKSTSEDSDPVRKKLQGLPKSTAPWYFEARLQQRIRTASEVQGNWLTTKPLPALALSVGVFLFLCVAGYYTLILSPGKERQILLRDSSGSTNSIPHTISEPREKTPLPLEQTGDLSAGKTGPNAPSPDVTVESGVHIERNQRTATANSVRSQQSLGEQSVPGLKLKGGTPNSASFGTLDSSAKRSRDSIKARRDSLDTIK